MDALTINEAAETTGWSPRMLRYIERQGLVDPPRTGGGYRLFGPAELQRLRTLRELLSENELELSDVAFAQRLRRDNGLRDVLEQWFVAEAARPQELSDDGWLRWEQDKHEKLLAAAGRAGFDSERPLSTTTEMR